MVIFSNVIIDISGSVSYEIYSTHDLDELTTLTDNFIVDISYNSCKNDINLEI